MGKLLKIGFIGAGSMLRYHIEGFRRAGAEVVAISGSSLESAKRAAETWSIPGAFHSAAAMLTETPELDAVSIIVPNKFHRELTLQCLAAGKHVFCEKPPGLNAAEVREMIAAAEAAKRQLQFNFNNRARPESRAMIDYIRDGTVGGILSAQAKWVRRTGIPGFGGWFTTKSLSGGGPLIDLLHMADLVLYLMDYPEPAHVLGQTFDTFISDRSFKGPWGISDRKDGVTDVETAAHAFVTFTTGQVLSLQISWAEMIKREEVSVVFQGRKAGGKIERIYGLDGVDETSSDTCELYVHENGRPVNRAIIPERCEDMGRSESAANFIRSLRGEEAPLNTPDQALKLMRIIDAIYASADTGRPVTLSGS